MYIFWLNYSPRPNKSAKSGLIKTWGGMNERKHSKLVETESEL